MGESVLQTYYIIILKNPVFNEKNFEACEVTKYMIHSEEKINYPWEKPTLDILDF